MIPSWIHESRRLLHERPKASSRLALPFLELNLCKRIRRNREIHDPTLGPLIFPTLTFQVTLESKIPTPQQLNQHNFDLIACEKPAGALTHIRGVNQHIKFRKPSTRKQERGLQDLPHGFRAQNSESRVTWSQIGAYSPYPPCTSGDRT